MRIFEYILVSLTILTILLAGVPLAVEEWQERRPSKQLPRFHEIVGIDAEKRIRNARRAEKEEEARLEFERTGEGYFFDAPFRCGFNKTGELYYRGQTVTGASRWERLDAIADHEIFENIKEL